MKLLLVLLLLHLSNQIEGQNPILWKEIGVAFETVTPIQKYETGEPDVYGADNELLAVDIQVFQLDEKYFGGKPDMKSRALGVTNLMGLIFLRDGGSLSDINGYYVITEDFDHHDQKYPVIVLCMFNQDLEMVYEVTVDCYHRDLNEAIKIVNSFRFL